MAELFQQYSMHSTQDTAIAATSSQCTLQSLSVYIAITLNVHCNHCQHAVITAILYAAIARPDETELISLATNAFNLS